MTTILENANGVRITEYDEMIAVADAAIAERDELRAKIEQMERQEPVGEIVAFGESLHEVSWNRGKLPPLGAKLYTLPGAKGEEK